VKHSTVEVSRNDTIARRKAGCNRRDTPVSDPAVIAGIDELGDAGRLSHVQSWFPASNSADDVVSVGSDVSHAHSAAIPKETPPDTKTDTLARKTNAARMRDGILIQALI
jgi:hypothetical protein